MTCNIYLLDKAFTKNIKQIGIHSKQLVKHKTKQKLNLQEGRNGGNGMIKVWENRKQIARW